MVSLVNFGLDFGCFGGLEFWFADTGFAGENFLFWILDGLELEVAVWVYLFWLCFHFGAGFCLFLSDHEM